MGQEVTNILLVDDMPARLLTYEVILERLGQNLVRSESGEQALACLDGMEFAAILLDVNMPGMDGFETAKRIRAHRNGEKTPIIFVTGIHVNDLDRLRGYELGAADYVYVPVIPDILRGKVQVLVQLYLQRAELARLNTQLLVTHQELERAHEQLKDENTRELQKLNRSLEEANSQLRAEVSERRRAEEQLTEAARRKDEFISILAHELRNPLAAIQSGVELMRLPALPLDKMTWARDLVERQLQHLVRLIDDLLDVSRVTTGRVQLQRDIIDLKPVITQSVDALRPYIDEHRHQVLVHLPAREVYVDADAVRLTQVLGNLLTNATKYMEPGGRIDVTLDVQDETQEAELRVRDQGEGLSSDMLDRVFELFTQANPTRRHQSGLGIGLALVRALVEMHGGTVHVSSDGQDQGCEFRVMLPLAQPASLPAAPLPAPRGREREALRLLIIDDNVDAANGLALYFQASSSHELRLAHTGNAGLCKAAEFQPDVILLDIGLPDLTGYEVARRLRESPSLRGVGIIAMTGFGAENDRRQAEEAGFDHFLVKPVTFSALEEVLHEWSLSREAG